MESKKILIEKNTIQETLIIPLYGRKVCSEKFPNLYKDDFAKNLCDKLDYDFSALEKKKNSFFYEFTTLEVAMRQLDIMYEIKNYLQKYPEATIVNLGCGLDETGKSCDNGLCKIVNVDFGDVISVRKELLEKNDREIDIACDLNDYSWMNSLDKKKGIIFFAAGVFYYFPKNKVKKLVLELSDRYPGGSLVFDSVGKFGLKLMMSKILKKVGIKDVEGFFYLDNPQKDLNWSEKMTVTTKGYMLGYYSLKNSGIKLFHRILAKFADNNMKLSINKIDFH